MQIESPVKRSVPSMEVSVRRPAAGRWVQRLVPRTMYITTLPHGSSMIHQPIRPQISNYYGQVVQPPTHTNPSSRALAVGVGSTQVLSTSATCKIQDAPADTHIQTNVSEVAAALTSVVVNRPHPPSLVYPNRFGIQFGWVNRPPLLTLTDLGSISVGVNHSPYLHQTIWGPNRLG